MSDKKSIFETLRAVDMTSYVKGDQSGNKYLTWATVWEALLNIYPLATFEQHQDKDGNRFNVSALGIEVTVSVTIGDLTRTFTHPVLNSINKSMKIEGYTYKTKKGDRYVEPASTFDVNTARMRALVKCIGLHGLAIDLYSNDLAPVMETIGSTELQTIVNKVKEKGIPLQEVCKSWNIGKIAELHMANYDNFINYLEQV